MDQQPLPPSRGHVSPAPGTRGAPQRIAPPPRQSGVDDSEADR
jgi:hypothetical protein